MSTSVSKNSSGIWFFVLGSTLLTCGLMLPIWLLVGLIYLIITLMSPPKPPVIPQPKTVLPSNDFASDWVFVIRDLDD